MDMLFIDTTVLNRSAIIEIECDEDELVGVMSISHASEKKINNMMLKETDYMFRKGIIVLRLTQLGFEINTHLDIDHVQDVLEDMLLDF